MVRTSWPMGMAERGSVLPGLIVLAGPELIWSPGCTPCGARTYEKPLKSPPGDPVSTLYPSGETPMRTAFASGTVLDHGIKCGYDHISKTYINEMQAKRHAISVEGMASQHQEMPPAGYFTSAMRALLFGSYSKRSTTAVSPLWERAKST